MKFFNKGESYTEKVKLISPQYFRTFRCKCGECRCVCCAGWRISLSESEYRRIAALDCSPILRAALDQAFSVDGGGDPERYAHISSAVDGRCRVLDEEGYCRLHRECGEAVQPSVCRLYPRSIKPGDVTEAVCSASCERVVEMLMEISEPLSFVTDELTVSSEIPPHKAADELHDARRRQCMELWQDRSVPLNARLASIGASLGTEAEENLTHRTVQLMRELGRLSPSLRPLAEAALEKIDAGAWPEAEARAAARMPLLERHLEQVMANHMFYEQFPQAETAPRDAYYGLYAAYAIVRGAAVAALSERTGDAEVIFADAVAAAMRYIEHTDFYRNAVVVMRASPSARSSR